MLFGIKFNHGCMNPLYYNPQRDLWWTVNRGESNTPKMVDDIAPLFGTKGFDPYSSTHLYKVRDYMAEKRGYKLRFSVSSEMFQCTEGGFFKKVEVIRSAREFCAPKKHRMFSKARWTDPLGHFRVPYNAWKEGEYEDRRLERAFIDDIHVSFPEGYWSYTTEKAYINAYEYTNAGWYFHREKEDDDDDYDDRELGGLINEAHVMLLYRSPKTHNIVLLYVDAKQTEEDNRALRVVAQPYTLVNNKGNSKEDYLRIPCETVCLRNFGGIDEPNDILRIRNAFARIGIHIVER